MPGQYYKFAEVVTKSDTLPNVGRAVYIGTAGDVTLQLTDGTIVEFLGCLVGTILPVAHLKIMDASDPGTGLVSLT